MGNSFPDISFQRMRYFILALIVLSGVQAATTQRRLGWESYKAKVFTFLKKQVVPHLKSIKNCVVPKAKAYLKGQAMALISKYCSVAALKSVTMRMITGGKRRLWGFSPSALWNKAKAAAKHMGCVTFKSQILGFCKTQATNLCNKAAGWAMGKLRGLFTKLPAKFRPLATNLANIVKTCIVAEAPKVCDHAVNSFCN